MEEAMTAYRGTDTTATSVSSPVERTITRTEPFPVDDTRTRDRIRWGPVWAGLVVTVAVYLLLQLGLVATGAVDLAQPTTTDAVASAVAAAVAFFVGGLTAGATAYRRGIDDGLLHGVVLWAVAV